MSEYFSPNSTVVAGRHQISCDLAGEAVILHLQDGIYYGLNPVGARVWQWLQEPKTVKDLISQMLDEYDVNVDQCERDLTSLLRDLSSRNLIEVRHEDSHKVFGAPMA